MRWALDWDLEEASQCNGCGQPLAESTDQRFRQAYLATEIHCFACETAEGTQRSIAKENDGHLPAGSRWRPVIRDDWIDPRHDP